MLGYMVELVPFFDEITPGDAENPTFLDDLPIELLRLLASHGVKIYRGLTLAYKRFSTSLTPSSIAAYKLAFGYTVEINEYYTEWFLNGLRHRTDGHAVEWVDGMKEWWVNGKRHRTDGPAIEHEDGTKEWWTNGKCTNRIYQDHDGSWTEIVF